MPKQTTLNKTAETQKHMTPKARKEAREKKAQKTKETKERQEREKVQSDKEEVDDASVTSGFISTDSKPEIGKMTIGANPTKEIPKRFQNLSEEKVTLVQTKITKNQDDTPEKAVEKLSGILAGDDMLVSYSSLDDIPENAEFPCKLESGDLVWGPDDCKEFVLPFELQQSVQDADDIGVDVVEDTIEEVNHDKHVFDAKSTESNQVVDTERDFHDYEAIATNKGVGKNRTTFSMGR